jgi:hypothetical protein
MPRIRRAFETSAGFGCHVFTGRAERGSGPMHTQDARDAAHSQACGTGRGSDAAHSQNVQGEGEVQP